VLTNDWAVKKLLYLERKPHQRQLVYAGPLSWSNWNFGVLVFVEGGKLENPKKKPSEQGREPTTNSTHIYFLFYLFLFTNFAKDILAGEISQNYCSNNETPKHAKKNS